MPLIPPQLGCKAWWNDGAENGTIEVDQPGDARTVLIGFVGSFYADRLSIFLS
jgi:hypothetical protein